MITCTHLQACFTAVENLTNGNFSQLSEDMVLCLCQLPDSTHGTLHAIILKHLNHLRFDPVVALLTLDKCKDDENELSLEHLLSELDSKYLTPEVCYK